ncbi:type II toxin-antitoxin system HipA family toxin [Oerskovia turbata]|uniref:type II toxin-antitoxin system HipA family toxin n=1 Tax=Oerskovia turbata TaxID=1713 RepID=UPI00068A783E|nr:type II toxin-antitoxin system HipA family toxin [Oerskovia turbata]
MSRELIVLLYGAAIATVTQDRHGRHQLTYAQDHDGVDATPLSLSMPVGARTHGGRVLDAYMAGLLPDSQAVRERWADRWGVSPENSFALLERMGLDCAGAVQFVAPDQVDQALTRPEDLRALTDGDVAERLAALRKDDSSWAAPGERWSLGGAQGKFTLARNRDGAWFEPTGGAASTHIVKPGVSGYRDQALNEHLCLLTAVACGLSAASTQFLTFDDQPALVVARYDRRRRGDDIVRIHQEDLGQALSVYPRKKYEASGGPGVGRIATLLRDRASDADTDVRRFVSGVIFNYLIGAPDAHVKNYSVLLAGPQVRLAPLYDVASALPYDITDPDSELDRAAMSIGGHRVFGAVHGRHWDKMARSCRVPVPDVRANVTRLAHDLPGALERVVSKHVSGHDELGTRLVDRVRALCRATLDTLDT